MLRNTLYSFLFFTLWCLPVLVFSQVAVTPSQTAAVLVANLVGPGVTVMSPSLTCTGVANGTFTTTGTLLAMNNGILLTNGHSAAVVGAEGPLISFINGTPGDPSVAALLPPGTATFDACILEFDMVAQGDTVSFNYQFGSEEYRNAVCSEYTDVFAFFISGPGITGTQNMALVPGTTIPVEINSVNDGTPGSVGGATLSNCTSLGAGSPFTADYIDNTGGSYLTYRGFTKKFRAYSVVTPCDTYHLKLTIVDAGNAEYDSGVFLEGGSLKTSTYHFNMNDSVGTTIGGMAHTLVKGCSPSTSITIVSAYTLATTTTLALTTGGTAVSGVDYTPLPGTVTIPPGDSTVTFTVTALSTLPSGTKTLILYLPSGCGQVDTLALTILDALSVTVGPGTTICTGSSFNITTTGTTGLTYSWSPASSLNSSSLASPTATPSVTTTYTLTATLPGTPCAPMLATVTVNVDSATANIITPDTAICFGQSVQMVATGSAGLSYSWSPALYLDTTLVSDPVATPPTTTVYTLIATAQDDVCTITKTVIITVDSPWAAILTPDTIICLGQSINIFATGSAGLSYIWMPVSTLNNAYIINPIATPTVTTTYTMTATLPGSTCPAVSAAVTISVDTSTVQIVSPDTSLCIGQSVTLMVNSTGLYNYSWSPATGLNSTTIQDPTASPTVTTTYSLTAKSTMALCSVNQTVTVAIVDVTLNILTPDTAICKGGVVQVFVNGPADGVYQWIPTAGIEFSTLSDPLIAPDTSATYVLYASVPGCTSLADSFHIDVQPNPTLFIGNDRMVCQVDTIHINSIVIPGNYPFYSYTWTPTAVLDHTNTPDVVFFSPTTTSVYLTVSTPAGCVAVDSMLVVVRPNGFASLTGDTTICPRDTIQLQPQGGASYQWNPPYFLSDPNAASPLAYPVTTTSYTVIAASQYGCLDTMSINITVQPNAVIRMPDSVILYPGETYQMDPQTNCVDFNWFPPAGLSSTIISNPVANPEVTTKYALTGITAWGCAVTDTILIVEDPNTLLAVPNAFAPGNGVNNLLSVLKRGEATLNYFRIYNRWGNLVFESNNIDAGWDGTFNGTPQPFDVYVYIVEAVTSTGVVFHKSGNVTLIR